MIFQLFAMFQNIDFTMEIIYKIPQFLIYEFTQLGLKYSFQFTTPKTKICIYNAEVIMLEALS